MMIFCPAGLKEVKEKKQWFEYQKCREIKNLGHEFGFQLQLTKIESDYLNELSVCIKQLGFPYGIHLPPLFADQMISSSQSSRQLFVDAIVAISRLSPRPEFVILHGAVARSGKPYDNKWVKSWVDAASYQVAFTDTCDLILLFKKYGVPICLENIPCSCTMFSGQDVGNTDSDPDWTRSIKMMFEMHIGYSSYDMIKIQEKTECDLVVDIEHLFFSINVARRRGSFDGAHFSYPELAGDAAKFFEDFGFYSESGKFPIFRFPTLRSELAALSRAKTYHLCGFHNSEYVDVDPISNCVTSHAPIRANDDNFRVEVMRPLLKNNPRIVVLETGHCSQRDEFRYKAEDVQLQSLIDFCAILQEEN